jgi:choline dehydrogenase
MVFGARSPEAPLRVDRSMATLTARSRPELDDLDLHIHAAGLVADPDRNDRQVFAIAAALVGTASVGAVRLRSADPVEAPIIDLNFHGDPQDVARMAAGVGIARAIATQHPLAGLLTEERSPSAVVDLPAAIRAATATYFHPIGACHMGTGADSVVDERCAVHGIDGLRVIDASVIPVNPHSTTNLPVLMLAERALALAETSA